MTVKINYDWQKSSLCKGMEIELFYPVHGKSPSRKLYDTCDACPVAKECLDHALKYEEYGHWSKTGPRERNKLRKELGIELTVLNTDFLATQYSEEKEFHEDTKTSIIRRKTAVCGTRAGYNAHRRKKEPTCVDCKRAQTHSVIDYKKKKKQEKEEAQA
jgi:hypothetical protein